MVRDIRVSNWNELNESLFEDSWQESLGRFRSKHVFRGVGCVDFDLSTSLTRLQGDSNFLEEHILRAFMKYAHNAPVRGSSVWNWLALAQHHGLPTRMLDWTYSPYVALHFATLDLDRSHSDGAIWCVNFERTNSALPAPLMQRLEREGGFVFTADMLHGIAQSLQQYDALSADPFMVFFEPPSIDERITNQYALFSLLSDASISIDSWLDEHTNVAHRIIVPASLKPEVRDKLDQANITERVLSPGLDGLSAWLKRYYTPRR
ncbi:MAG: FRG domain-containing protein [Chloroflexota bacterium]